MQDKRPKSNITEEKINILEHSKRNDNKMKQEKKEFKNRASGICGIALSGLLLQVLFNPILIPVKS